MWWRAVAAAEAGLRRRRPVMGLLLLETTTDLVRADAGAAAPGVLGGCATTAARAARGPAVDTGGGGFGLLPAQIRLLRSVAARTPVAHFAGVTEAGRRSHWMWWCPVGAVEVVRWWHDRSGQGCGALFLIWFMWWRWMRCYEMHTLLPLRWSTRSRNSGGHRDSWSGLWRNPCFVVRG